ncbi:MAG: iron-sulfur cluster-binding protein [Acidobacteria bacterium]|nr:iron-sulfur cluster-binding protein [Acidobacteriota bacterium]
MEVPRTQDLEKNAQSALQNQFLRKALWNATSRFLGSRQAAVDRMPEWEQWREGARQIKEETLAHLDSHLERLIRQVEARGGVVFQAADGPAACRYIVDLARARGIWSVVKGKSMTTEEIGLAAALEGAGIEALETDLGEYIVQLAREMPSHILAPAIHKSREDVSTLFAEKLGLPAYQQVDELTRVVRSQLRDKFLKAGMGITGANFVIAESGTLVLVENEGNIRLSTSLPPLHVAVVGREKVLPGWAELEVFLKLLPRSATGQKMTSYVSFLSGPRKKDERDGASEFHLVLLDNGRSGILRDPELRESLHCIRCGACLNICPVYRRIGGHAYGWIYPGPIGSVLTPLLLGLEQAQALPFASSLCGACEQICPVKIDIPRMLLALRRRVVETLPRAQTRARFPRALRGAVRLGSWLARHPRWYRIVAHAVAAVTGSDNGWLHSLPGPLSGWTKSRDFPSLAKTHFQDWWKRKKP